MGKIYSVSCNLTHIQHLLKIFGKLIFTSISFKQYDLKLSIYQDQRNESKIYRERRIILLFMHRWKETGSDTTSLERPFSDTSGVKLTGRGGWIPCRDGSRTVDNVEVVGVGATTNT